MNQKDYQHAKELKRLFMWQAFAMLDFNEIDGDYCEFGCAGGTTFCLAYNMIMNFPAIKRHMYAFDSFQGLPQPGDNERHPKWVRGAMRQSLPDFRAILKAHGIQHYEIVKGFYSETLPKQKHPQNIALAYVDCDMYSSTQQVLEWLSPRLKHGMILAFDDYFCYSKDGASGEQKALSELELKADKFNFVQYRDIGWGGTSFIVEKR